MFNPDSPTGSRLNLGCGAQKLPGYVNVDKFGDPDVQWDLETFPWPWSEHSVTEIQLIHVLEHLGQTTAVYLKIIQELYRICQHQATIRVVVPHHRHDNFVHDPTHVRAITPLGLSLFSRQANHQWQAQGCSNTPLALYLNVDFELIETRLVPSPLWYQRYPQQSQNLELLLQESLLFNNLIEEVEMTLKVIKEN